MADRELKLLILEDDANDIELIKRELRRSGVRFESREVATGSAFALELDTFHPDVIISDYFLPQFNALDALQMLDDRGSTVPLILVTGSQTEEVAVECMKRGADDYILKSALTRLPAAVQNAHAKHRAEREKERAQRALRKSEEQYRLITENSRDLICMVDDNGAFLYASPSFQQVLGYRPDSLKQGSFFSHVHSDDLPGLLENFRRSLKTGEPGRNEFRYLHSNLTWRNVEAIFSLVQDDAEGERKAVFVCRDITDRKRTEEALRTSEERYALAAQGANDGLWDWNLKSNEIYFSPRWKAMLGFREEDISHDPEEWFKRVHPDDLPRLKQEIAAHLQGLVPHFQNEHRVRHKDGRFHWMLSRGLAILDESRNAYRMAGSQTDITARKMAEEQLLHNAFYDPLTELPNRAMFMDRLNSAVEKSRRRADYDFAVLFLDLDRFKVINDSLGHSIGDRLLIAVARRLESCLRAGAMVARLGGDEFAVFLDDIRSLNEARSVADRIHKELSLPFNLNGRQVFTSASIGINFAPSQDGRAEEVLRDADTAMYRAKAAGKARSEVFEAGMHRHAVEMLQMEADIRKALDNHEFIIHYQPIVCLLTQKIVGYDSMIRWQHPARGIVFPLEFLPVAQETGLITPIIQWALNCACRQNRVWKEAGYPDLRASVKYPAKRLSERGLIDMIRTAVTGAGMSPGSLELALTECSLAENVEGEVTTLQRLEKLGVQLSIDDFGSGYSALGTVKRLPISGVKIKRSFIRSLLNSPNDEAIVTAIVTLARSLNLRVTAEGVENQQQVDFLRSLKCDEIQGFISGRPIVADSFLDLLRKQTAPEAPAPAVAQYRE